MLLIAALPSWAYADSGRTVRVAYPLQPQITDIDDQGTYEGYTYEYLEEIAQYTGWDYEFVRAEGTLDEQLIELMGQVERGEVDLIGAMLYTEGMAASYDYASQSYGTVETVLQVPFEHEGSVAINSQVSQKLRIAVVSTTGRSVRELEEYCAMNLIEPEYVVCEDDLSQVDAVREGRADVLLNVSLNYLDGVRTIARFSPKPFYFATGKGQDPALMDELNGALLSIQQADPDFSTELSEKYFAAVNNVFSLTDAERAYVQQKGTLRVGALTSQPPFQYRDGSGELKGIAIDLVARVAEETGLAVEYVEAETFDELRALADAGSIDMVAGMPYDYDLAREASLSMTRSYAASQYVLLLNEKASENNLEGRKLALPDPEVADPLFEGATYYPTTEECVRAVAHGEADFAYLNAYVAQYYVNQPEFSRLKLIPLTEGKSELCFGVSNRADRALLSILNKAVSALPNADMQAITYANTIQKQPVTLASLVQQNPFEAVAWTVFAAVAVIALLLVLLRARSRRSRQAALELEKHFRVYALANEYFFEYDFRTGELLVLTPTGEPGTLPERRVFVLSGEDADAPFAHGETDFKDFILSGEDGVREMHLSCPDGKRHWLRVALQTVSDQGTPVYALGKLQNIDGEKQERDALTARAQLDSLTHVYNAETSRELIEAALGNLEGAAHGAAMLIDIDFFKEVNDTYGHLVGDQTLERFARLLEESFRGSDVVGRPGGDEFVVYLARVLDEEALARRCADLVEHAHRIEVAPGCHITISIGAALTSAGDGYEDLYRRIDRALYDVKDAGRDGFRIAGCDA